jgi:cytochrome c biogenesis factor
MLTALILICSLTVVPDIGACTEDNAMQVLRNPETFTNPVTCLMHGQAYLANTAMGRDFNVNEVAKVVCVVQRKATAAPPAQRSSADVMQELAVRQ